MQITVRLLSIFKELLPEGQDELLLEIAPGVTVADVAESVNLPATAPRVAIVEGILVKGDHVLQEGATVTFFPPLAGG